VETIGLFLADCITLASCACPFSAKKTTFFITPQPDATNTNSSQPTSLLAALLRSQCLGMMLQNGLHSPKCCPPAANVKVFTARL
jgi:hypothetical protein